MLCDMPINTVIWHAKEEGRIELARHAAWASRRLPPQATNDPASVRGGNCCGYERSVEKRLTINVNICVMRNRVQQDGPHYT